MLQNLKCQLQSTQHQTSNSNKRRRRKILSQFLKSVMRALVFPSFQSHFFPATEWESRGKYLALREVKRRDFSALFRSLKKELLLQSQKCAWARKKNLKISARLNLKEREKKLKIFTLMSFLCTFKSFFMEV